MARCITLLFFFLSTVSYGQIGQFDYPDTLWLYGKTSEASYGRTPTKPIRVGGGVLPKHIYRYLNNLICAAGSPVKYERIGSCCSKEMNREEPLTAFSLTTLLRSEPDTIYFDQYSWETPNLLTGYYWTERRMGYYGQLKNDSIFNGEGIYFFDDGGYYKGDWNNGFMEGIGILHVPDQETYYGAFIRGKYEGHGTIEYADGGKYVGNWKNDLRQGHGILYYPAGLEVEFIEGEFKYGKPKGLFTVKNADGTVGQQKF